MENGNSEDEWRDNREIDHGRKSGKGDKREPWERIRATLECSVLEVKGVESSLKAELLVNRGGSRS